MVNFVLPRMAVSGLYISLYVPYVHNPERTWKILRIRLKIGNGRLGKLAMNTLDSPIMKKMAAYLNPMERKLDTHATYMVNSFGGILFLTKLLNSTTCSGIGCDTSSWW